MSSASQDPSPPEPSGSLPARSRPATLDDWEQVHLIEVNPNPDLAYDDLFAESALKAGVSYEDLLTRIMNLGLQNRALWSHG